MLYTLKYAPKKLEGFVGNSDKIEYVRQWILQWLSGKKRKPLLLWGPPGVGKTSMAYAIKEQYDLDLIEMNASELRNKNRVERVLGASSLAGSLFGRGRLLLIDDADVLAGRADFGGGTAISNFLKESTMPAIVTATDIWDKKLAGIRNECEPVEMKRVNKASVRNLLGHIAKEEGLSISGEKLDAIAENAEGDVRAALNDLQSLSPTSRTHEKDIFQIVRGIFKAEKYSAVRDAISGDIDYELIKLWMDENIPYEYERAEDVAAAYDSLSRSDIYDGRDRKSVV
jgi:replication factor C large subunit